MARQNPKLPCQKKVRVSYACTHDKHNYCYTLTCSCPCHERALPLAKREHPASPERAR